MAVERWAASSNEWPWWWRVLHRLIRWIPVEPVDEIEEQL